MGLSDLTDPQAVRRAIEKFVCLRRERFLKQYGFGKARAYFLLENGKEYDSKAIAGVAYGFQYPEIGPLKSADFSGGEATVKKKLEELGFKVIVKKLP